VDRDTPVSRTPTLVSSGSAFIKYWDSTILNLLPFANVKTSYQLLSSMQHVQINWFVDHLIWQLVQQFLIVLRVKFYSIGCVHLDTTSNTSWPSSLFFFFNLAMEW
jgi:hypothetical protein